MYVPGFITPQSWSYCMTCCCQDNSMEGYWPSSLRTVNFCDSFWFCYGVNQYLRTLQSWSEYSSNRSESSDKQIMWQIKKVGYSSNDVRSWKMTFATFGLNAATNWAKTFVVWLTRKWFTYLWYSIFCNTTHFKLKIVF